MDEFYQKPNITEARTYYLDKNGDEISLEDIEIKDINEFMVKPNITNAETIMVGIETIEEE